VVDHHHAAAAAAVQRARGVGLDLVVVRSPDADRLGEHGVVVHVGFPFLDHSPAQSPPPVILGACLMIEKPARST
jgi:hypothetical protein